MGEEVLIEFSKVKKEFKDKKILNDVTLKIIKGEIFGLAGRSGSGKTTLLRILVGITKEDSGKIIFEGKTIKGKRDYLHINSGFASQENTLIDELTLRENAEYFGRLSRVSLRLIKTRFMELVKLVDLMGAEDVLVKYLSGGMRKRANFLVSLIHNPKLLILDEPTAGLDFILRRSLWKYIHDINKNGTTILVTSHLLDEVEENCDRIAMLDLGKVLALGTPKQYREHFKTDKPLKDIFEKVIKEYGSLSDI